MKQQSVTQKNIERYENNVLYSIVSVSLCRKLFKKWYKYHYIILQEMLTKM